MNMNYVDNGLSERSCKMLFIFTILTAVILWLFTASCGWLGEAADVAHKEARCN